MPKFSELIVQPPSIRREAIDIPEWGGTFYFRDLTALKHQELLSEIKTARGDMSEEEFRDGHRHETVCLLLSKCLEDEDGMNPSVDWLMSRLLNTILRLGEKAMEMNGLGAKTQGELEKN